MKNLKNLSFLIVSLITVSMLNNSIFSAYVPAAGEEAREANKSKMAQTIKRAQERLLIEAISKGNLKEVEKLLKSKVDPEAKGEKANEGALALAQRKLQEAEASSDSETDISNRKLIVDLIKKEITNKNLKNPELRKDLEDFEVVQFKPEKLAVLNLINDLEIAVQKFLNKQIKEEELTQKAAGFKADIVNYLNQIHKKNSSNQTALSLAKEYYNIYQLNAKKKMTYYDWSSWLVYGDPVTKFWDSVITTLQNYGAK